MRKFFIAAAVAVIALVASGTSAQAAFAFTVTLHETGSLDQTFNLTSGMLNTVGPVTIGDYSVTVTARDSAPGIDPVFNAALISQNTFTVVANAPAAANLQITVQDNSFSSAGFGTGSAVTVNNSLSTTLITSGTVTANGYLTNAGNTATLTTPDISLNGPTLSGSVSNGISGSVSPIGATYTLGNFAEVHFTGTGAQQANFTVTTLAPVPAPAGLVLALTGMPMLGIGAWIRRRRQAA